MAMGEIQAIDAVSRGLCFDFCFGSLQMIVYARDPVRDATSCPIRSLLVLGKLMSTSHIIALLCP